MAVLFSLQDNRVTLQLMLVSPYVADLKQTVEGWMKHLEQLEEILDLWVACQRKVLLMGDYLINTIQNNHNYFWVFTRQCC